MFLLKKILPFAISFSLYAQDLELPSIVTVVSSSRNSSTTIVLDEEKLKDHKTLEEALAREGFSFKGTNNESTFHGFWNASVKVYVDQILMNDPNTGYFDWSSLDYSVIKKIVIDTASVNGCVSIYITTLYYDYTGIRYSFGVQSKSYLNSVLDSNRATAFVSSPVLLDSGSALYFSDSASVDYDQNHFGFRSKDITERTDLSQSYTGYEKAYDGYEKFLVNNSFLFEYNPCWYNGASFGFKNFISLSDANCGRESGTYYKKENQRNLNTGFSVPVFIPSWI